MSFYDPIDQDISAYTAGLSDADDYNEPVYYCSHCDDAIGADSCLYFEDEPYCCEGCIDEDIENNK